MTVQELINQLTLMVAEGDIALDDKLVITTLDNEFGVDSIESQHDGRIDTVLSIQSDEGWYEDQI